MARNRIGELDRVPSGRITVEYATTLHLTLGTLGSGNAADAAAAAGHVQEVAPPGTHAPVTLSVLNSPQSGRRVGFVEVRLADSPAVRYQSLPELGFITDGGDGGFFTGDASKVSLDDAVVGSYVDAFYPRNNSQSGNVCVGRRPGGPSADIDAVLFSAGYGDGYYPAAGGYDHAGKLVSVVSYGYVIPWRLSGLPGTPPQEVLDRERQLQRPIQKP